MLTNVVAIPAPPPFLEWGIGGILSPQNSFEGVTVIDMTSDQLLLVIGSDDEVATWLNMRVNSMRMLVLERDPAFGTIVVPASIAGDAEVPILLNTGGRHTEFAATAVPTTTETTSMRIGGGVGGTDVVGAGAGEAAIVVGGHELTVPLVVRESIVGPQGMIGMDVLRGTILTVSDDAERSVFWQLPVAATG